MSTTTESLRERLRAREAAAANAAEAVARVHASSPEARHSDALRELEAARAEVAKAERAELERQLDAIVEHADEDRLLADLAPKRAHIRALLGDLMTTVSESESIVHAHNARVDQAMGLAKQLGVAYPVRKFPLVIAKVMTQIELARDIVESGQRYVLGHEPWTWLTPRSCPGFAPFRDGFRRAISYLPPGIDVTPPCDWHKDLVTVEKWSLPASPHPRPERHVLEVL